MSLGVAVVATSKGAEGIEYTKGKDILIADKENDFAAYIINLLSNKTERLRQQKAARKLVEEKYDWNIIGKEMASFINNDLLQKPAE